MKKNASSGYRIDERVLYVMTALIIFSSIVLAFRFKNVEPCYEVTIDIKALDYFEGSLVSFKAETKRGHTYKWDFGDGARSEFSGSSIQHTFKYPGTYVVSVVVNERCEGFGTVIIKEAPVIARASAQPEFIAPDTSVVNKPVTFIDTTADATSWEWRFGESNIVDGRSRKASCIYRTPGPKTIFLRINGRRDRVSTKIIYVKAAIPLINPDHPIIKPARRPEVISNIRIADAPSATGLGQKPAAGNAIPDPPKPKPYPDIQADEMIILVQGIVSGEKKDSDFFQYFCDGTNIPVVYNGTPMKFSQMYNLLKAFKKQSNISKPEVQLVKNASTNCVKQMTVNVSKRSRLDKILGKKN